SGKTWSADQWSRPSESPLAGLVRQYHIDVDVRLKRAVVVVVEYRLRDLDSPTDYLQRPGHQAGEPLARSLHRPGDLLGSRERPRRQRSGGLDCTHDCQLHPRLAPSDTTEVPPRHVRNREDHDTRKSRSIGPDPVVDPVADESGYVRVVPQVAPERLRLLHLR